jgi:hypothetical protein
MSGFRLQTSSQIKKSLKKEEKLPDEITQEDLRFITRILSIDINRDGFKSFDGLPLMDIDVLAQQWNYFTEQNTGGLMITICLLNQKNEKTNFQWSSQITKMIEKIENIIEKEKEKETLE